MEQERGSIWAEAWREALRGYADPVRWRRGVHYYDADMVVRIFVVPGRIVGKVEGSRVRPYDVQISAPLLRDQPLLRMLHFLLDVPEAMQEVLDHVPQLIPNPHDVEFVCSCPDWGDPCKHGVALWLAAAERFAREPEHLLRFRGIGTDGPALRTTGSGPHDVARGGGTGEAAEAASAERTVSAQRFWHGDPEALNRLLAEGEDTGHGPPSWVFSPPAPWPDRGIPFATIMERIYAGLGGDATKAGDEGTDDTKGQSG